MSSETEPRRYLRVAVAAPLAELFDYLPPSPPISQEILPGMRVLVPFGRGRRVGVITAIVFETELSEDRLKPVESVLDRVPLLTAADLRFVLWAADYYRSSPAEALFTALPARLRRPEPLLNEAPPGWRLSTATPQADDARERLQRRAPRQAELLALLDAHPAGLDDASLRARLGNCAAVLRALADKGLIERCRIETEADAGPVRAASNPPQLNPDQHDAVEAVRATTGFHCFLLDGVTGSGKTEVYLRLIDDTLHRGHQVLVLVPEIGLTPQLRDRFAQRIDAPMAVLHSALGERERELAWQQAAQGRARLVLGTRSAIFTPLPDLGLIIVDEEHDQSLKQQDGFRYSARDLAVRRAQLAGCPIMLGSATPSLETLRNARLGRYRHLILSQRAGAAVDPKILVADIRAQPLQTGLCHALLTRMEQEIGAGNQVLLFLNRRGFSPVLTCHDCGWISECRHCDARMTLHLGRDQLLCHHCGLMRTAPHPLPLLRIAGPATAGPGHRTRRGHAAPTLSRHPAGPHRPRQHPPQRRAGTPALGRRARRVPHPARHPNAGQGTPPARHHAGGHPRPRPRPLRQRLPRHRAHGAAAGAGSRSRRTRRAPGHGDAADAPPAPPHADATAARRLRRLRRRRARRACRGHAAALSAIRPCCARTVRKNRPPWTFCARRSPSRSRWRLEASSCGARPRRRWNAAPGECARNSCCRHPIAACCKGYSGHCCRDCGADSAAPSALERGRGPAGLA